MNFRIPSISKYDDLEDDSANLKPGHKIEKFLGGLDVDAVFHLLRPNLCSWCYSATLWLKCGLCSPNSGVQSRYSGWIYSCIGSQGLLILCRTCK